MKRKRFVSFVLFVVKKNGESVVVLSDKKRIAFATLFAESEGFEPPEQLPVHRISSAARSTTPATFLVKGGPISISPPFINSREEM